MVLFGVVTMISAPLIVVAGTAVLAPLWLVGGAAGMVLARRHSRRRAQRHGVTGHGRRVWGVAVAMSVVCVAAGVVGGITSGLPAGVVGPIIVVGAGYLALGWLQRDLVPTMAIAPGAALAVTFAAVGLNAWMIELTFGTGLVVAGIVLRSAEPAS